jgi:hypothetical protein
LSKTEEFEEKIREQRILEATKKGLMGQNGKIGIILKTLGQPIVSQSEGGYHIDSNYIDLDGFSNHRKSLEDISDSKELMRNIPIMDVENSIRPDSAEWDSEMPDARFYGTDTIGLHFDGLNRGMHLEIKYDENSSELVVYHKGYLVYKEIKGELLAYAPNEEWEKWIESLSKKAKEEQRKIKEEEFEHSIKENERQKMLWWEKIKDRWGIK